MDILIAALIFAVLGAVIGALLAVASKAFEVPVDEKAEKISGRKKIFQFQFARQKSDRRADFFRFLHDAVPRNEGVALVGADQRGKDAEHRRFSRAVRSEQAVYFALIRSERQPVERDFFARFTLFEFSLFTRKGKCFSDPFRADDLARGVVPRLQLRHFIPLC